MFQLAEEAVIKCNKFTNSAVSETTKLQTSSNMAGWIR